MGPAKTRVDIAWKPGILTINGFDNKLKIASVCVLF